MELLISGGVKAVSNLGVPINHNKLCNVQLSEDQGILISFDEIDFHYMLRKLQEAYDGAGVLLYVVLNCN